MPSRRLTLPAVTALALACIALGVLAALADGSGRPVPATRPATPAAPAAAPVPRTSHLHAARPAVRVPVPQAVALAGLRAYVRAARPAEVVGGSVDHYVRSFGVACDIVRIAGPVGAQAPRPEPVPDDLLHAFGILRRAATGADALPRQALQALRDRGLEPFDPAAARLVRTTPDGGRAWVVPTRNVPAAGTCANTVLAPPAVVYNPKAPATVPARPARPPQTATAPAPAPAAPTTTSTPAQPKVAAHPGLALVALGGAPVGAGGRYEDLIRGREDVAIDACAGPGHDMLGVSGLVPDGVPAAFLTSPDGTAIRADVRDNAYTFVVPRSKRAETRYVVWTGGDGTPHVQPLSPIGYPTASICARLRPTATKAPAVSPSPAFPFLPAPAVGVERLPTPHRHK